MGWNIWNVLLDFEGGLLSLVQLMLDSGVTKVILEGVYWAKTGRAHLCVCAWVVPALACAAPAGLGGHQREPGGALFGGRKEGLFDKRKRGGVVWVGGGGACSPCCTSASVQVSPQLALRRMLFVALKPSCRLTGPHTFVPPANDALPPQPFSPVFLMGLGSGSL